MQQNVAAAPSCTQETVYLCRQMYDWHNTYSTKKITCFFCETIWNCYSWGESEAMQSLMSLFWRTNAVLMGEVKKIHKCTFLLQLVDCHDIRIHSFFWRMWFISVWHSQGWQSCCVCSHAAFKWLLFCLKSAPTVFCNNFS